MQLRELAEYFMSLPEGARQKMLGQFSPAEAAELLRMFEPLNDFIPRATPKFSAPTELQLLVDAIEQSRTQELRLVVHAPPRHRKTDTLLNGYAWLLGQDPTKLHAYASYEAKLAKSKSRKARELAVATGVRLADDASSASEWITTEGGGLFATGVGGPLTGRGVTGLLVVDDPVKNRVEAESETTRDRIWDWFNEVAFTRLEKGASVVVCMTRWHPKDLAGRLVDEKGWKYLRLPALDDDGKALWAAQFDAQRLADIREQVGEYTWASLYQGAPRARGGSVFGGTYLFDSEKFDITGAQLAIGVDGAYNAKTHSDWSVAVLVALKDGFFYVLHVERHQIKAPQFHTILDGMKKAWGVRRSRWYTSTTEAGTADLLGIEPELARGDKFARAIPTAAKWNAGKILMPKSSPWGDKFALELGGFTGIGDKTDDQVDALVAAIDCLAEPSDADKLRARLFGNTK